MSKTNPLNTTTSDNIAPLLKAAYGIVPQILEKSAWGYNTVAYYARENAREYVIKVTTVTQEKIVKCQKDVRISLLLSPFLPTPSYLKNVHGDYLTTTDSLIFRVADYMSGTAPFKMTFPEYKQVLEKLLAMHKVPVKDFWSELQDLDLPVVEEGKTLLHGDLTPSNVIVSNGVIVGVLDFEDALLGPVEYDLAKSTVFCWFRMSDAGFKDVFDYTVKEYLGKASKEKLLAFCVRHAQKHLGEVIDNKSNYDDDIFWNDDFKFSSKALEEIKALVL